MEIKHKLKFSIITVCRNAEDTIEKTIQSVLSQAYDRIEYIIIDGASTDGTLAITQKYSDRIAKVISEPDKGIYDAMNKGISAATGDYIFFLNSGDRLTSEHVIAKVNELIEAREIQPDIFYGRILVLDEKDLWGYVSGFDFVSNRILFLDNLPHQSTFVRVPLLKERPFDTAFKIASDFDWFVYAHVVKRYNFRYADIIISMFDPFGLSADSKSLQARISERVEVLKRYYTKPQLLGYLLYNYFKTIKYPAEKRKYVLNILKIMRINLFHL